jgi:hypothetical protein
MHSMFFPLQVTATVLLAIIPVSPSTTLTILHTCECDLLLTVNIRDATPHSNAVRLSKGN